MGYEKFVEPLPEAVGFVVGWRLRDHYREQRERPQQEVSGPIALFTAGNLRLTVYSVEQHSMVPYEGQVERVGEGPRHTGAQCKN